MVRQLSFYFVLLSFCFGAATSLGFEVDSTEDSSIDFANINAEVSSKIIHFTWNVNAEKDGDYFLIEKSLDKKTWSPVTRVESIENHKDRHTYSVSEINFAEGINEFFRISRIDRYGNTQVLDIINVHQPILNQFLLIPLQGEVDKKIRLSYDSRISAHGEISVVNEVGKLMFNTKVHHESGYNSYVLDIKNYPEGNYVVVVTDQYSNKTSRMLKVYNAKKKKRSWFGN